MRLNFSWTCVCTALYSSVDSNPGTFTPLMQFVWEGVNTSIALGCRPKQPDRDLVEEVVLVWFQTNSGTVCLWWEHDSTSIQTNCRKQQCFPLDTCLLRYGSIRCFAPPSTNPRSRFQSDSGQYDRQLLSGGQGVPSILTWSLAAAVIGRCYKNNNTKCFRPTNQQKSLCLSLFWDLWSGVNMECFILKSNRMW